MIEAIFAPFSYGYMQNAALAGALVGAICGLLSCWLVLKGWSLIGDALAHAVAPGVAGAMLLSLPLSFGAVAAALLATLSMLVVKQRSILREDAVIGLILTSFFGLGLFIASLQPIAVNIQSIAFGDILAISPSDLIQLGVAGGLVLAFLILKWKDLAMLFFDENGAAAIGLPVRLLRGCFFVSVAVSVVAAMQTVGAVLAASLIIAPGAAAMLLSDRFPVILTLSALIGSSSVVMGLWVGYQMDGATGGVIILIQTLIFALCFLFAPKYGKLAQKKRHLAVSEDAL